MIIKGPFLGNGIGLNLRCKDPCFPSDSLRVKYRFRGPILDLANEKFKGKAQEFTFSLLLKVEAFFLRAFAFRETQILGTLGSLPPLRAYGWGKSASPFRQEGHAGTRRGAGLMVLRSDLRSMTDTKLNPLPPLCSGSGFQGLLLWELLCLQAYFMTLGLACLCLPTHPT
jgi:hypothetical protein